MINHEKRGQLTEDNGKLTVESGELTVKYSLELKAKKELPAIHYQLSTERSCPFSTVNFPLITDNRN